MIDSIAKLLAAGTCAEVWLPGGTTLYVMARGGSTVYGAFPEKGPSYTGVEYPLVPKGALWWPIPVSVATDKYEQARLAEAAFLRSLQK
jgi:hypothetical protein